MIYVGVMDLFYNKEVDIYVQENGAINALGYVETAMTHVATLKAVSSTLNHTQVQDRYGVRTDSNTQITVEFDAVVHQLLITGQVVFVVDKDVRYKVESMIVFEQFYVLDSCINMLVTRVDG